MSKESLIKRWQKYNQQPKLNILECKLCKQENSINLFKVYKAQDIFYAGELVRYQCPNCEVIFGDLRFLNLPIDEIGQDYIDLYSWYKEADTTQYILKSFYSLGLDKNLKGLDYACGGWNNHLPILNQEGYQILGYDKYVTQNKDYILEDLKDIKFDYIINNNYIEHVINPIEDINLILKYLKKDGLLIFMSPCWEYKIEITHYHTFFFVGKSVTFLESLLNIQLVNSINLKLNEKENTIIKIFKKL